jgi:site-specific DNA-methyltransferase (adenine-specific)
MRIETGPGWELRCGDCLDSETGLASLDAVDHVITDPPYSKDLYARTRTTAGDVGGVIIQRGSCSTNMEAAVALASGRIGSVDDMIEPLAAQWARIVRRWVLVFHCDDLLVPWRVALMDAGLSRRRNCVWLKPDPMPQLSGDRPAQDVEHLTMFHAKGRSVWRGGGRGGSVVHPRCKGKERPDHPSPKPIGVMTHYVDLFTDHNELICDPFAGSGTTGVAALRNGRRFIGWERDEKFFDVAVKRLRSTREQTQLFDAIQRYKPKQVGLFDLVDDGSKKS